MQLRATVRTVHGTSCDVVWSSTAQLVGCFHPRGHNALKPSDLLKRDLIWGLCQTGSSTAHTRGGHEREEKDRKAQTVRKKEKGREETNRQGTERNGKGTERNGKEMKQKRKENGKGRKQKREKERRGTGGKTGRNGTGTK